MTLQEALDKVNLKTCCGKQESQPLSESILQQESQGSGSQASLFSQRWLRVVDSLIVNRARL